MLLFPEGALVLNETAVEVLELCDGERTLDDIAAVLSERYDGADVKDDVAELLDGIGERGLVVEADAERPRRADRAAAGVPTRCS